MKTLFFLCLFLGLNTALASHLKQQAEETFIRITESLQKSQNVNGAWQGVIEADPSVDLMPLVLAKKMGLSHPQLEEQTLERIFARQTPEGFWTSYPGGEKNLDVTATIILNLKYIGIPESDPRVMKAWAWYQSNQKKKLISAGNRLIGVMGGWLPKNEFVPVSPLFMAIPDYSPINIHSIGFTRMAVIPYTVFNYYEKAQRTGRKINLLAKERIASKGSRFTKSKFNLNSEFWAQEGLGWILDRQQADGTWGGALQMTYFTMIALHQAQLAGAGDFSSQINKAWNGLMSWRAKIPEGSVIQQSTVGPVMDTARILSAIESAPKALGLLALPEKNRDSAAEWLLKQQITKDGEWKILAPDVKAGGWTFEYFNDFNPDCDDTAMAIEGLVKTNLSKFSESEEILERGVNWLTGMQNKDGGFPAWDRDTSPWFTLGLKVTGLPEISDDSQVDITSRSIKALHSVRTALPDSLMAINVNDPIKNACRYLEKSRKKTSDSPLSLWRGEWMTNYLYGTSEAVGALLESGCWDADKARPYVEWLLSKQQENGGWGESPESYLQNKYVASRPTLSQSEWVIHMLIQYEKKRNPSAPSIMPQIENGIGFLLDEIKDSETPYETEFTGTFVRGFWYARYVSLAHYEAIRTLGSYLKLIEKDDN